VAAKKGAILIANVSKQPLIHKKGSNFGMEVDTNFIQASKYFSCLEL